MGNRVRMAVVGGQRKGAFGNVLASMVDSVELVAVYDLNPHVLAS